MTDNPLHSDDEERDDPESIEDEDRDSAEPTDDDRSENVGEDDKTEFDAAEEGNSSEFVNPSEQADSEESPETEWNFDSEEHDARGDTGPAGDTDVGEGRPTEERPRDTDETHSTRTRTGESHHDIDSSLMGRDVKLPSGDQIGIVADVDSERDLLRVEEDPDTTDKIKAHLHWGDESETSTLTSDQIRDVQADAVVVEGVENTR